MTDETRNPLAATVGRRPTAKSADTRARIVAGALRALGRTWRSSTRAAKMRLGHHPGYRLMPNSAVRTFTPADSQVGERAGFAAHDLWVTPTRPDERWPAGDYINQSGPGDGLHCGFTFQPFGFFDCDPTLDIQPSTPGHAPSSSTYCRSLKRLLELRS